LYPAIVSGLMFFAGFWVIFDSLDLTHRIAVALGKKVQILFPLNSSLRQLLEKMRREQPGESPEKPVMQVFECQKSIDRAANLAGVKRITHHDLRHLFATRCIESGVDIPTVSRWLGHQDGGAKTYGHLRDEHSQREALKVTF
jgi:integrase